MIQDMKLKQCSDIQYMIGGSVFDVGSAARVSSLVRILEGGASHSCLPSPPLPASGVGTLEEVKWEGGE